MAGQWELIRIAKPGDKQEPWLLFKKRDAFTRPGADYNVLAALPDSVIAKPLAKAATASSGRKGTSKKDRDAKDSEIPGAVKATLPDKLLPQLATLATGVPARGNWVRARRRSMGNGHCWAKPMRSASE